MTILLCLFKASVELPKTQTELYQKFICHTIVHFLKKTGSPIRSIDSLSDLEQPHLHIITKLAKVSFKLLENGKIVFTADDVLHISRKLNISSESCTQLGLLKETKYSSTKEAKPVSSYSFLHLSLQEFFAAMHVASLSFFQQTEILQRTFWNPDYFNMWIMYMGLTAGKKNAFKYFLSSSFASFIKNRLFRRNAISKQLLVDKIKCLHLFHCFQEANNDTMCAIVGGCFEDLTIDLSSQTLLPRDVNILCFYLLRSAKTHWNKLVLSGCSIGDIGCNVMRKSLIVSDKNNLFLQYVDLSNNQLTVQSVAAIVDLVCYCKVVQLNIADNPLHNALLQFLGEFKHLKSLVTGNATNSDNQSINETMKIIQKSSLQYISINDSKNSSLVLRINNFEMLTFPTTYLKTYQNLILQDCKGSEIPNEQLLQLLKTQKKLVYFFASNNGFSVATLFSVCAKLTKMVSIEAVVIAENDLSHSAINEIATQLSSIPNCRIYSKRELKCIGTDITEITEILAGHQTIDKIDIISCNAAKLDWPNEQLTNIVEDFKFTGNEGNSLLYLAKALNLISLKVFCITSVCITDETANELALALHQNQTLNKFEISDCQLMNASANKMIHSIESVNTLKTFKIRNCGLTDCKAEILLKSNCTLLTEVDISNNKLRNLEAIKALQDCCNLQLFKINGNNFTDVASQDVAHVLQNNSSLVEVDVACNNFTSVSGELFLNALCANKSLKAFRIGDCITSDGTAAKVASIISQNPGLTELDLSENYLTTNAACTIVQALKGMASMRVFKTGKLMVNKDTINEMIAFFSSNVTLTTVDISSGLLSTGGIKLIRSFKNMPLQVLRMSNCRITQSEADEIADAIKEKNTLLEIDLSYNRLLAVGMIIISRALKGLASLQVLNLQNCGIADKAVDTFTDALSTLVSLTELDISGHVFTPKALLGIMKSLQSSKFQTLKMNYCSIFGWLDNKDFYDNAPKINFVCLELSNSNLQVADLLNNSSTLEILKISKCSAVKDESSDELSVGISNNRRLVSLDASQNNLTAIGAINIAKALQSITTLQTLLVNNCSITDEVSEHIAAALTCNPLLTELDISWNKLTGHGTVKIIQSLSNHHFLSILKIASCGITANETEAMATFLHNRVNLIEIDISSNELNANGATDVLKAISTINYLQQLKIDNCGITDKAADSMAATLKQYKALTRLAICGNNFTVSHMQTIVSSLKALLTLKELRLSNCNLDDASGEIANVIGSNHGLLYLEMYRSHFSIQGASLFLKSFTNVCTLQHLKLINCSITEEVAGEIAAILAHNKTIEHLDLSHNPLAAGITKIIQTIQSHKILQVLILQSCEITDQSAFDLATFAKSTSVVEFDMLRNELTANGAFIIAKGFMDSLTLKVLKMQSWGAVFREGLYEDEDYILNSLKQKDVSLVLNN